MSRRPPEPDFEQYARELGQKLRRLREARGLSQERVAHVAGISAFTYFKFEKGESKPGTPMNPQLLTLLALSQALGVRLDELLPDWEPDVTAGR